jgi:hypothetical protein
VNSTHRRHLVCADDVNFLVRKHADCRINTEALSVASKKADPGISALDTKYTSVPRGQNVRQNYNIKKGS